MVRRRYSDEEIVKLLREFELELAYGRKVRELCR
jgi:hypothetical protein